MKIAFVGGGSYGWGPDLLGDLALSKTLGGTVCLNDIDSVAGERMQRLGQKYMAARDATFAVTYTPSLDEALDGADYVLLSITTGGLRAMRGDVEIPETYGIYQTVGDTVGPGGIARGLRNIPVIVDLARRMERLCPDAWLLNVTNPMTTLCRAATRATSIRTIGLCHEYLGVQVHARELIGPGAEVDGWQVAGVNHLPWVVGVEHKTLQRLHDRLAAALPEPDPLGNPFGDGFRVKLEMFDLYGTFPAAGDRHVAEFFPHYLTSPAEAFKRYGLRLTRIHHREANRARDVEAVVRQLDGRDPINLAPSGEQAVGVIEALAGFGSGWFVVNIPNQGQLASVRPGAVVECMATIDRTGVQPVTMPLPSGAAAWVQTHVAAQELVVQAALEERTDLALQALLIDPLSHRLSTANARSLLRELVAHNKAVREA
jgi:galacturan 1,4-alpha-galacturonidase